MSPNLGIPDIRDELAEVMAKFSVKCQNIFEVVTTELSYTLGSETTDLKLRCGLHSGPVTAGVLRGLQSRLEIFSDTINTASRMERNGIPTRIQLSQATTDLLIKPGKESWVQPKDGCIIDKGKGKMQMYWLTMTYFHASKGEDAFSFE